MPRRILAAVLAALGILALTPERLNGEATTTSSLPPTSTTGEFDYPPPANPSPHTLYPDRPDARYEDVEAAPADPVELGPAKIRLAAWAISPHDALPGSSAPARTAKYESLGLTDRYEASSTTTTGDLLHATIRVQPTLMFIGTMSCVATAADGTVLVPYDLPLTKPSADNSPAARKRAFDLDLYLPLGSIRGRLYLVCRNSAFDAPFGEDRRAVWGIDV